ncbi:putative low-affinity inorganic phosphate transporter [Nakamurella endophytica]|uniref:Phosphate transporter n=1 Tax=Nakamurella endophytica TaxID=1748367 RepID=A0A917WL93_9ACTN|nr:inorganic phosphate transporter [Nakamurella endophytica]GGM14119.1 putative low-affinity inorganic phosphate transporter [Nakamurella endophytica]
MGDTFVLVIVVVTALAFDFTNGFHDTANAMATSIATGALRPRVAVALSAALNLVGAFVSLSVAATIAGGLVRSGAVTLSVVLAGLVGAITWNLVTWFLGIPSSSSHALIGGVVGATIAAAGGGAVRWDGLVAKVVVPAALSPVIAGGIAIVGTVLVYRLSRGVPAGLLGRGFRLGQIGSASLVSLAHGTNDAQKTMGVITLALIAGGSLPAGARAPLWVVVSCALAISLGTFTGGWRVIRTLGTGIVDIEPRQGMAAETASAATILLSTYFGYSLSTTHVATGSILGTGLGYRPPDVRWGVARRMALAWLITLPTAAVVGGLAELAARAMGGTSGIVVVALVIAAVMGGVYLLSRRAPVGPEAAARPADRPPAAQDTADGPAARDGVGR